MAALSSQLLSGSTFPELVQKSFEKDKGRGNNLDTSLSEATQLVLDILEKDSVYETEYRQFVDAMSYARDDEQISFQQAVFAFQQLALLFVES